jgi:N-acetylneuraminic acid mutarotase
LFFFLLVTQICFAQGSWTQIGDMSEIRYGHTVNEINGKIYVVGGLNTETGVSPRTALVYNRSSGVWMQFPLYNNKIRWAHTSCVVDGKLYVMGGNDSTRTIPTMDMFDPNTGQWESKDSMSIDRGLAASASIDGKIYVIGGLRKVGGGYDYGGVKTMEMYDVITGTWSQLPDMPTKRWGHSAVAYNGKIYVVGGVTFYPHTTVYKTVEVYNPQDSTWTTESGLMPTARYCVTSCLLNNKIYAIGGWYHSSSGPIYNKVEVYNPDSSTWYIETPMPVARAVLTSIVLDGKIYVYGGSRTTHPLIGTSEIYEFSIITEVEEELNELPTEYILSQNYPNPFNPATKIRFSVPQSSNVIIKVFDILGNEIATLVNEEKPAGSYEMTWHAANLPSGVYFYRLRAGNFLETKKMILLR